MSALHRNTLVLLPAVLLLACGGEPADRVAFPPEGQERVLHCNLMLSLTQELMEEVAGVGPAGGFIGHSGIGEVTDALRDTLRQLDSEGSARVAEDRRGMWRELVARFDHEGDGRLTSEAELDEFNRHVTLCVNEFGD